jgi:hypothetical protein
MFKRLNRLPRPVWLTAGVVAGLIAVPAVTVAATATIVNIQGNGHTASVSPAGQLRTVEMDPSTFTHLGGSAGISCKDLGTASTSRAFVARDVSFANITTVSAGDYVSAVVIAGSSCAGGSSVADAEFAQPGSHEVHLGDGVAVPAGTHLWLAVNGGNITANVYGYTVTPNAVPHTAAALRHIGPAR